MIRAATIKMVHVTEGALVNRILILPLAKQDAHPDSDSKLLFTSQLVHPARVVRVDG